MVIIAIVPELGVSKAVIEYMKARKMLQDVKRPVNTEAHNAIEDQESSHDTNWGLVQAFYANMGGYTIRIPNQARSLSGASENPNISAHSTYTYPSEESIQDNEPQPSRSDHIEENQTLEKSGQLGTSYTEYKLGLDDLGQHFFLTYGKL
jgi:hypothetical protein